jgi:hypothetical protein
LNIGLLRAEKSEPQIFGRDQQRMIENRPANVPQRYADQAAHARHAVHARIFLLGGFVSVANKECCIQLPKLDVAGSIPVARSKLLSNS